MTIHYAYADSIENVAFRFHISVFVMDTPSFPVHTHDFAELVIILGGTGLHITNAGPQPFVAGDVFVIKEDVAHGFDECHGLKLCNIIYDPDEFLQLRGDIVELAGYYALFVIEPLYQQSHAFRSRLHLGITNLHEVEVITRAIEHEFRQQSLGYQSMIQGYFTQLVVYLSRQYALITPDAPDSLLQLAYAVMLLESTYQEPLTLDDLALAAHLSKSHLLRLFKATFQLSPIQYLLRLRIAHACELLKQDKYSVNRVAFESGFSDSNYFARQFKQVMGMTPSAYCRQQITREQRA